MLQTTDTDTTQSMLGLSQDSRCHHVATKDTRENSDSVTDLVGGFHSATAAAPDVSSPTLRKDTGGVSFLHADVDSSRPEAKILFAFHVATCTANSKFIGSMLFSVAGLNL